MREDRKAVSQSDNRRQRYGREPLDGMRRQKLRLEPDPTRAPDDVFAAAGLTYKPKLVGQVRSIGGDPVVACNSRKRPKTGVDGRKLGGRRALARGMGGDRANDLTTIRRRREASGAPSRRFRQSICRFFVSPGCTKHNDTSTSLDSLRVSRQTPYH